MARPALLCSLVLALGVASACGNDNNSTAPTPVLETDTFNGVITPLGTDSKPFTVNYSAAYTDASVTVTSLTTVANNTPESITIGVGFGTYNVGVCTRDTTYSNPTAALNAELPTTNEPFIGPQQFCVQVFDNPSAPTVTEPLNYTIVVKHY